MSQDKGHMETGNRGEEMASKHLRKKGYKIIERNWRTKYGEIDIIAGRKDWIILVEVRTKIGEQFGTPEDTLDDRKMQRLVRNANAYIATRKLSNMPYRIDAVCVVLDKKHNPLRVTHYENIAPG